MSVAPSAVAAPPSRFQQFYALTKPRVVQLIVFCALIGMVLAVPGLPNAAQLGHMALACLGVWLHACAGERLGVQGRGLAASDLIPVIRQVLEEHSACQV